MDGHVASLYELVAKVWHRIKVYFRLEWKKLVCKVKRRNITLDKARWRFSSNFGQDIEVFQV